MLRAHPDTLFVFGDNMQRRGYGGQAAAMRGEPNAVGIPTKWAPSTAPAAFFADSDWDRPDVRDAIDSAFILLADALRAGRSVAIPADGLGTGRAELATHASRIAAAIAARIARLEAIAAASPAS
ncbi:MAG: hypothetical protein J0H14_06880 [Alphaproteobacteria bacterium]|nr:hypothetical protein [Alphaproteobacteria bacterium]